LNHEVIDLGQFENRWLHGGFVVRTIELTDARIEDPLGREATAQTQVVASEFRLLLRSGLSDEELSVTLYHEILEAACVAVADPPVALIDFNEADFERAARKSHARWGNASLMNLNLMLQFYGFRGQ
jgi:hypothetical protein